MNGGMNEGMNQKWDEREQKLVCTVTSCVCRFVSWSEKSRQRSPQNATN